MGTQSQTFDVQIEFGTPKDSQEFLIALEQADLVGDGYRIGIPDDAMKSETEIINVLIKFVESGGPEAVEAVAGAIKAAFTYLTIKAIIRFKVQGTKDSVDIRTDDNIKEISEKLNEGLFKQK